ncbi:formate dehydrogenase subunit alpha [Azospirillum sp. BE72]|uniref:formate dehydrogenase subunit alpha n=1 Tax=Azospirillum sp. BE72 TaxID=2817776 RepID=UPI00285A8E84|nr:formate dehydrogenase subunit alpha [Azospirillum sp. BE72]MDR6772050.1 formate dehydrogenase major subunit [Azospirillum sp. BE72]
MLVKRSSAKASRGRSSGLFGALAESLESGVSRRGFLRQSGLAAGGIAAVGALPGAMIRKAEAGPILPNIEVVTRKNVCTHCSVGCTVIAEVQNGVWVGQEPGWESPINQGTHCAKGASVRELTKGTRRVKYPLKLVDGVWQRISWDQAIEEIGNQLLEIRQASGPDAVFWLGSAKFSNEGAYLYRKLAAFWGTNNVDHQARICHSTTVAGVANTWGYGAMTNSYNDIQNSKALLIVGGNPAEAHPVSMQHMLRGKEHNRAPFIVIDPRFTRTAAHATEYVRIRPGTDIPIAWGLLWHIFESGWEDKEYIRQRVYGMDEIRAEVKKWTPEEVERVTGVPGAQLRRVAEVIAKNKPSTVIWCMGVTQHTVGTANVRALSILQLALGNIGVAGGGANIYRGHCNVQGATDFGLDVSTLPAYYGLAEGAWKHFARAWDVEYDYLKSRFGSKELMEAKGIPTTRWFDAVLAKPGEIDQPSPLRAMMCFGHGGNTVTRMPEMVKGLEKLSLLVIADPHPTTFAAIKERRNGTYILPACTQFETDGSRTCSNRSMQWGERVVEPIFESKDDYTIIYLLARKLGFADEMFKHITVENTRPVPEDILREMNRSCLSIGATGQSPERLKMHMKHQADFDKITMRAASGPCAGDYYGLPWPSWGHPEIRHPGSAVLYDTSKHVMDGGGVFRARFGVERNGVSLLADGSYSKGSEIEDGYPEFTMAVLKKLGWDKDLTSEEMRVIQAIGGGGAEVDNVSWQTDLSMGIIRVALKHGCVPHGNAKARAVAWNLPDPVPIHREPIYSPRPDLVKAFPAVEDRRDFRLVQLARSLQFKVADSDLRQRFPMVLTSGRLVEYEGGGEETRSNVWLAELQQSMFVEINTKDAERLGIKDGAWVWVYGPEDGSKAKVKALVTDRVGGGTVFMPFHFSGFWQGESLRGNYPPDTDPIVLGEPVNGVTTYGYDPVTFMQETKVTLCRVEPA